MISANFCGLVSAVKHADAAFNCSPLSVRDVSISSCIRGWAADTTAVLTYENGLNEQVDAQFVFPVTEKIGLYSFQVVVGEDKTLTAKCQHVQASGGQKPPAQASSDVHRIPIGKVEAGSQVRVTLGLVQQLRRNSENGRLVLDISSVLVPRQLPRWEIIHGQPSLIRDKLRLDSNHISISDVEYKMTIKCNVSIGISKKIARIRLEKLDDESAVKVDLEQGGLFSKVDFTRTRFRASDELKLIIEPEDVDAPAVFLEPTVDLPGVWLADKTVAAAWYEPGTSRAPTTAIDVGQAGDEYWLVLDRSGSMFGAKNEEAKRMLLLFVKSLPVGSRFNVVGFGSRHEILFPAGCVDYSETTAAEGVKYATGLKANLGGTSVMGPLNFIYSQADKPKGCRYIILLTDGQFAESIEAVKRLVDRHSKTSRLFTIGIGKDVNRQALEELARVGCGLSDFIEGVADFQPKVIRLMKAMNDECLAGFTIDWAIDGGVVDKRIPVVLPSTFYFGKPMSQCVGITKTAVSSSSVGGVVSFAANEQPTRSVRLSDPTSIPTDEADTSVLHRFFAFKQLAELLDTPGRIAQAAEFSKATGFLTSCVSYVLHDAATGQACTDGNGSVLASFSSKATGFSGLAVDNKAEIRAGKADDLSVQLTDEVVAPAASFEAIAGLQQTNGSWPLNEALVKVVGSPHIADVGALRQRVLRGLAGSKLSAEVGDDEMGTLVALAVLRQRFMDRHDQWLIIEQKAHAYLKGKSIDVDSEMIDLIAKRLEGESGGPTDEELLNYSERNELFSQVDQHALAVSKEDSGDEQFQDLITRLINSATIENDLEKARALFIWLSSKDLSTMHFSSVMPGSPEDVLMGLKDSKETYAAVYEMLCTRAGLTCVTIRGYVKGIGYRPGSSVLDETCSHQGSWNAVKIDGKWRLVNANWAARRVVADDVCYELDEFFFLTEPRHFIHTHFPFDAQWQLLDQPISLSDFERLPPAKSLFYTLGISFVGQSAKAVLATGNGEISFALQLPNSPIVDVDYSLKCDDGDENLRGHVLNQTGHDSKIASLHLRLPHEGHFRLIAFVAAASSPEHLAMTAKDDHLTYTDICEWKIISTAAAQIPNPYPPCSGSTWGAPRSELAKFRGFSSISPSNACIQADEHGMCQVYLDISTRAEIFFLGKLRSFLHDDVDLDKCVMHRRIGDRVVFTVCLPVRGEFGLEIFTNSVFDGDKGDRGSKEILSPLCQYVINGDDIEATSLPPFPKGCVLGPQPTFFDIGLSTSSHADPLVTFDGSKTPLQIVFDVTPEKTVKSVARLTLLSDDGSDDEDVSDWVWQRAPLSGRHQLAFICRFSKIGCYKLEIFALPSDAESSSLPIVFIYLVQVSELGAEPTSISSIPTVPKGHALGPQASFSEIGLSTLSHHDPLVIVDDAMEPLQIVFGLENEKSVKAVADLTRLSQGEGDVDENMSKFVLHQAPLSGNRIAFVCRFPEPGSYTLETFALPKDALTGSASLPCVYCHLIQVIGKNTNDQILPFPKQFSPWHNGCFLVEPLDGVVRRASEKPVSLQLAIGSQVRRVLAVAGNASRLFAVNTDGIWEVKVPKEMLADSDQNKLDIVANFILDPPNSFTTILQYELV